MRNGILGKHGKAVGGDQIGDTVVDLRIHMIWSSRQNDSVLSALFEIADDLLALILDITACLL